MPRENVRVEKLRQRNLVLVGKLADHGRRYYDDAIAALEKAGGYRCTPKSVLIETPCGTTAS